MRPMHAYTAYLTPEAEQARLHLLVERLATKGFEPGESVPPRVMQMLADFRASRLTFESRSNLPEMEVAA